MATGFCTGVLVTHSPQRLVEILVSRGITARHHRRDRTFSRGMSPFFFAASCTDLEKVGIAHL